MGVHVGRKSSIPSITTIENPAVRSSLQDARGTLQIGYDYDDGCDKKTVDSGKLRKQISEDLSLKNSNTNEVIKSDNVDGEISNRMSFADLSKQKVDQGGIQLMYMQNDKGKLLFYMYFLNKYES